MGKIRIVARVPYLNRHEQKVRNNGRPPKVCRLFIAMPTRMGASLRVRSLEELDRGTLWRKQRLIQACSRKAATPELFLSKEPPSRRVVSAMTMEFRDWHKLEMLPGWPFGVPYFQPEHSPREKIV